MRETRLVCIDFESGRVTAWGKTPGGVKHRFGVMGPYQPAAMRGFAWDQVQIEEFRQDPVGFMLQMMRKYPGHPVLPGPGDGPEAA